MEGGSEEADQALLSVILITPRFISNLNSFATIIHDSRITTHGLGGAVPADIRCWVWLLPTFALRLESLDKLTLTLDHLQSRE